eukprot:5334724-Pleurochrysis_carterae.AAC.2
MRRRELGVRQAAEKLASGSSCRVCSAGGRRGVDGDAVEVDDLDERLLERQPADWALAPRLALEEHLLDARVVEQVPAERARNGPQRRVAKLLGAQAAHVVGKRRGRLHVRVRDARAAHQPL